MSVLGRRLALVSRDLLGMSSVCACRGEMKINLLKVYSLNLILLIVFIQLRKEQLNIV